MDTGITPLANHDTKTKDDQSVNETNRDGINDKAKVESRSEVNGYRNNHTRILKQKTINQ